MRFIIGYLKPFKKQFFILAPLYAFNTLAMLLLPFLMSNIVNYGIALKNLNYIFVQGGIMLGITLLAGIFSIYTAKQNAYITANFSNSLFQGIFSKITTLSMDEFNQFGASSLLTRSTHDVYVMQELANHLMYALVNIPILFVGGVILTLVADPLLSLILFSAIPIIILVVWLIARRMTKLWENADKHIDEQNKIVRERISGIRVIRAFGKEDYEHNRMAVATKRMAKNIIKSNTLSGAVMPLLSFLFNLAIILILYVGANRLSVSTTITAGDILATVQYVSIIMAGCMMLTFGLIFLPQIMVSIKRIGAVLSAEGQPITQHDGVTLDGDIHLEDVTFSYPNSSSASLSNISMDIANGQKIAIIGGTGSGKTTLTRLLLHLYMPTEGSIYLGGKSYSEISRETARDNISIVLQKGMIFHATIEQNIRLGNSDASQEELDRVTEIAQLDTFIDGLPDRYQHMLTQTGSNISGGQKQRINIARSLLKKASVYIFDDSFSNLDFLTEAKLRKQLDSYLDGKTQIIITQRATTAMRCDKIFVLDAGVIVGQGSHEQLLKDCSIYNEIYRSQTG